MLECQGPLDDVNESFTNFFIRFFITNCSQQESDLPWVRIPITQDVHACVAITFFTKLSSSGRIRHAESYPNLDFWLQKLCLIPCVVPKHYNSVTAINGEWIFGSCCSVCTELMLGLYSRTRVLCFVLQASLCCHISLIHQKAFVLYFLHCVLWRIILDLVHQSIIGEIFKICVWKTFANFFMHSSWVKTFSVNTFVHAFHEFVTTHVL